MSVLKTYGASWREKKPSKTYRLKDGRLEGMIDGLEAARQAAELMLSTERFKHEIFSDDYGVEFLELIGQRRDLIEADLERRIEEALAEDDRMTGISDFSLAFAGDCVHAGFVLETVFGTIQMERSIMIG